MSGKNLLMLFAPKFNDFGCDVARAFLAKSGGGCVHGLCTGPPEVRDHAATELSEYGGQFWRLEDEELTWLATPASSEELEAIERDLGPGAFGRIVIADRRVGRGFVRGGLTRPDRIGRTVERNPATAAQRYVNGLYRFLQIVLQETEPSVVFCYAVAGAPAVALAELCRVRNISFCKLTPYADRRQVYRGQRRGGPAGMRRTPVRTRARRERAVLCGRPRGSQAATSAVSGKADPAGLRPPLPATVAASRTDPVTAVLPDVACPRSLAGAGTQGGAGGVQAVDRVAAQVRRTCVVFDSGRFAVLVLLLSAPCRPGSVDDGAVSVAYGPDRRDRVAGEGCARPHADRRQGARPDARAPPPRVL